MNNPILIYGAGRNAKLFWGNTHFDKNKMHIVEKAVVFLYEEIGKALV